MVEEVMIAFSNKLIEAYNSIISLLPLWAQNFINLFFIVLIIFAYALFIWKLYRFIATKNIFEFDLSKYNTSKNPLMTKLIAGALYLLEYIIILPFLIFFWFSIFTLFLIFLTQELPVNSLLIVSAVIVAAVRMAAYYREDLAKDLAKLIPFTLLAVSLLNPGFFDIERILSHFEQIPTLLNNIVHYLIFIIILEIILRSFDFIFSLFGLEEENKETEEG
ncbi:hypothetical protein DRN69_01670 [Candidatus Pacearchaeota archaeon]|nr:MAG: hypothetical protein DRN69_01670 [Candidatus Pacearchaeota archaeon]